MTERPILFSGPMVRALLAGTKTQTRRIVKGTALDWLKQFDPEFVAHPWNHLCPYGVPGDRLWVRETYAIVGVEARKVSIARAERMPTGKKLADTDGGLETIEVDRDTAAWAAKRVDCERWKPAIFMPRWACRLVLEVTGARVECLQAISEDDALAEGCFALGDSECTARRQYEILWDSLNAKRGFGWASNPWVWVIEFRREK